MIPKTRDTAVGETGDWWDPKRGTLEIGAGYGLMLVALQQEGLTLAVKTGEADMSSTGEQHVME